MVQADELDQVPGDQLETEVAKTTPGTRAKIVNATLASSDADEKKGFARAAADQLPRDQLQALRDEIFPQDSIDRRWVYVTGFIAAAVVALGVALIAWGVSGESRNV